MINLEWYRTFKAVYETGSLTAASKQLFISQPNVSQHILALEAYIGKSLFERKHKAIPTDYAQIIYAQIVDPIDKLEETEMIFKKMCLVKNRPTLNIGAPKEYFHLLATANMKEFPAIIISSFGESKDLLTRLVNRDIDFALTKEPATNLKLKFEPILEEELWIVGSNEIGTKEFDGFIKNKNWEEAERWLLRQNWLTYNSEMNDTRQFWKVNFKKRPVIVPQAIIPDVQTILNGIANGNAVTVASNIMVKELVSEQKLKVIWKGETLIKNQISLVYDDAKAPSAIVNIVKGIFSE